MLPLVILAGGLARRMLPVTESIPKSLIPVLGRPFIAWQLELLASMGFSRIEICTGHLSQMIEDYVGDGHQFNLQVSYSHDGGSPLGTGGAIHKVSKKIDGKFLVTYGDSYLPVALDEIAEYYSRSSDLALMTILKNNGKYDKSNVIFGEGKIVKYSKNSNSQDFNYIDFGFVGLNSIEIVKYESPIPWDLSIYLEKQVNKGLVTPYEVHNRFYEIGSPSGLRDLEDFLKGKKWIL